MKLKNFPVKCLALLLAFCALSSFITIGANAAGSDDGELLVTTKNSKKYLGETKTEFCTLFTSANGDDSSFYRYDGIDLTKDSLTDITDLVALNLAVNSGNGGLDLNFDASVDYNDVALLRGVLIGNTDVEIG